MPPAVGDRPLVWWERVGLALLVVLLLAFLSLVEVRSAFLSHNRMTDAGVYFRAGWAVRTGRTSTGSRATTAGTTSTRRRSRW